MGFYQTFPKQVLQGMHKCLQSYQIGIFRFLLYTIVSTWVPVNTCFTTHLNGYIGIITDFWLPFSLESGKQSKASCFPGNVINKRLHPSVVLRGLNIILSIAGVSFNLR